MGFYPLDVRKGSRFCLALPVAADHQLLIALKMIFDQSIVLKSGSR